MGNERTPYVDATGVVDPLRVPRPVRDGVRAAGRLPLLGWVFVALAVIDAGLEVATPGVNLLDPRWLIGTVGGALVVALPAAVLFRRPDAFASSRSVLAGSVLVALGAFGPDAQRLLGSVLRVDPGELALDGPDAVRLAIGLVLIALSSFGWLYIAVGLDRIRDGERPRRGLGAALGLVIVIAAVAAALQLVRIVADQPEPFDQVGLVLALLAPLSLLAFAYLAWVVGGQAGLAPRTATLAGALAVGLVAGANAIASANGLLLAVTDGGDATLTVQSITLPLAGVLVSLGRVALFAAFLLGLADPPDTPAEAIAPTPDTTASA